MKDYCTCRFRRTERVFLSAGLVCCSDCDKPVWCAAVALDNAEEPHAAEIAYEENFVCWRHWDCVADLEVTHSAPNKVTREANAA